jgi:hypothetical protein
MSLPASTASLLVIPTLIYSNPAMILVGALVRPQRRCRRLFTQQQRVGALMKYVCNIRSVQRL